jgi:hypothetical protein
MPAVYYDGGVIWYVTRPFRGSIDEFGLLGGLSYQMGLVLVLYWRGMQARHGEGREPKIRTRKLQRG